MKDSKFFSVVIPTLNEERFLPRLLNNLQNQKIQNFEVIIADGKSTDKTKEKALEYSKHFPIRFYVCGKKNVSYQRNFGARMSVGKFIIFLDADSGISKNFTERLKKFIDKNKGLVIIPYIAADNHDPQIKFILKMANIFAEATQTNGNHFRGGNLIVERNLFDLIGGFDEKLFILEDHNLVRKAFEWGVKPKSNKNIKVKFSLRRMRREGRLIYFYKNVLGVAHIFFKGDVKDKIFEYRMGGGVKKATKDELFFKKNFKNFLEQLKLFIKKEINI